MADSGDSVPGLPEPGGRGPVILDGMRVLRLCSVFGPAGTGRSCGPGVDTRLARQAWALLAAPLALSGAPVDVVHGHCGEDIAVLPLARLAVRRHHCPLVVTVHASVRHNMRVTSARTAWLRLAGGPAERRALAAADMVIALTPARR
jgi:glycosyltransferase involved in cell wall biosynthesis